MFFSVSGLPDPEVVAAAFANYNAWLTDYCSIDPSRLIGAALLPMHDPGIALATLERAVEAGAKPPASLVARCGTALPRPRV